jgi:mRNA interferase RelE/StbE
VSRRVGWTKRSLKELAQLDRKTRQRIEGAVERQAESGAGDVWRLAGLDEDVYRLRVGDWRVIFSLDGGSVSVLVLRVRPRGDAYKRG